MTNLQKLAAYIIEHRGDFDMATMASCVIGQMPNVFPDWSFVGDYPCLTTLRYQGNKVKIMDIANFLNLSYQWVSCHLVDENTMMSNKEAIKFLRSCL